MTKEKSIDEIMAELANQQCWYPFADCTEPANDSINEDGTVVNYCRPHARILRRRYGTRHMDLDAYRAMWIAESNGTCGCEDDWAICDKHMAVAERLGLDLT